MRNLFGLLICVIGGYIFQFGFRLLSDDMQTEYDKRFTEKMKEA